MSIYRIALLFIGLFFVGSTTISLLGFLGTAHHHPLVVMGDLNTSQWSPYFQRFIHDTGLNDTQRGFGVQASWPADAAFIKIPIDHVLVSSDWAVLNRRLGPNVDSDHLPVIVDLKIAK